MAKLLSSLPVGALVKDTDTKYNNAPIIWQVLEHGHDGTGTTTLASRDIITLKCFDAKEPNNSDSNRKSYGNNRYLHSNILQWLNSDSASWYTAQHNADQAPDSSNVWASSGTPINPYDSEAGFLTHFSSGLKAALQTVSKVTAKNTVTDGGGYESVSSKIFLLSTTEVGLANENNVAEGTIYEYYSGTNNTNDRRKKNLANDAAKGNYSSATSPWYWWLRTPRSSGSRYARFVHTDGTLSGGSADVGGSGVAPAYVLLSSLTVSDNTDSDGCYVIQFNAAPTVTPDSDDMGDVNSGFTVGYTINDADGDTVSCVVKLDGTQVDSKASVTLGQRYTYTVTSAALRQLATGSHSITVTATDSNGATGTTTIAFNRVTSQVTISGSDGNKGNIWLQPSFTYQIGDTGSTQVNVVEAIDGVTSTTKTDVPLNTDITFTFPDWAGLSNEQSHTVTITATNADGISAVRTWTFTKLYGELSFYTNAIATDEAAKKINVIVNYEKTGNPELKVEVCNDARAISPTWENATSMVTAGKAYDFQNEPESSSEYGVAVRVTVKKSASTERVYVTSLGFSFA